jgi:uncharacterized protein (DUF849 family)
LSDGSLAAGNAALVKAVGDGALLLDRNLASANDARRMLGMY